MPIYNITYKHIYIQGVSINIPIYKHRSSYIYYIHPHIYIDILYRVSCTELANIQYYIHPHIYIDILYRVSCTKHANIHQYIQAHIYIYTYYTGCLTEYTNI